MEVNINAADGNVIVIQHRISYGLRKWLLMSAFAAKIFWRSSLFEREFFSYNYDFGE
jgi:hypothetical protein